MDFLLDRGKKVDWNEVDINTIYEVAMASSDLGEFSKKLPSSRQQELKDCIERNQLKDFELKQSRYKQNFNSLPSVSC